MEQLPIGSAVQRYMGRFLWGSILVGEGLINEHPIVYLPFTDACCPVQ